LPACAGVLDVSRLTQNNDTVWIELLPIVLLRAANDYHQQITQKVVPPMKLVPTILCGGVGSRLWPLSRELHPKPFIRLADGESLLQKAFLRGVALENVVDVMTVTNRELFFKTEDEYREVNHVECAMSFVLEPSGRNTAPAIAAAALQVQRVHGDDAIMLVLAADHLVADQKAFAVAVQSATKLAQSGKLVTFGITPVAPETGYGYLEAQGSEVLRFVEKPTLEKAQEYILAGNYFWNSGMFCFSVASMLTAMERYCPEILNATKNCVDKSRFAAGDDVSQLELDSNLFLQVPDISIDYAVMEKSDQVAVVACDIGWSDVGSWDAIGDLESPDVDGNRVKGTALMHDSTDCFVHSDGRVVGLVGVRDLLIIDTPDALLVADRKRAQDVKHIYAGLKNLGHDSHKLHRTVHRPWGTYTVLEEGEKFKIKRIEVKTGASLSLQMHHHRSEHWIVVSGLAQVVNGDQNLLLKTNESTYIPAGHKHRLANPGVINLVMIEVQSGDYLGEDDIVRFQDNYGRA
jgi:mannose-1-phosphate guanylyltransferase / mannose-6-phosphate isomerase